MKPALCFTQVEKHLEQEQIAEAEAGDEVAEEDENGGVAEDDADAVEQK